jgi:N-acetyl-gamma-glutamylphosphate reductase
MAEAGRRPGQPEKIRVAVVGATGYVGAELVRLLDRHPAVTIVGLVGRGRDEEPLGSIHPHLASTPHLVDADLPTADAVFLALPHGASAELVPAIVEGGATAIDKFFYHSWRVPPKFISNFQPILYVLRRRE